VRGAAVGESVVREAARRGSVVREGAAGESARRESAVREATVGEPAVREAVVRTAVVRRKARPVRRAVLSAVTLGAVGAAAAAAAALLGAASDSHSPRLADIAPPQDPVNTPQPNGGLSVSVSTPAATGTSSGVRGPNGPGVGGQRPTQGGGTSGISGTVTAGSGSGSGSGAGLGSGSSAGAGGGGGSSAGGGVSAADFKVSVNQRAADPDSVAILLRNVGSAPIAWSAVAHDPWVTLSQRSGTLGAGQSQTIVASVTSAAPSGAWTSTVTFAPGGAVVTLRGVGGSTSGPSSRPTGAPSTTAPATGGASASSSAQTSSSASPGSTPTSAPTVSSSSSSAASTGGVGPSTAGPSRSGGASASASGSAASTSGAASSAASSAASASGSQTASGRRR
jgi:BACON domain-containing protein